jgi:hypothetical protein
MKTLTTLILSTMSSVMIAQIPNASFETWSGGNPVGWYTGNSIFPGTTTQSSNAQAGSSSASLNSVSGLGGFVGTGVTTDQYFINSGNPPALNGWYILNTNGGDDVQVIVSSKCSTGVNGGATTTLSAATSVYKQFSVCWTYGVNCTADSASIFFDLTNPGGGGVTHSGSYALIDDLTFGPCTSGIDEVESDVTLEPSYPNPANEYCNLIYSLPNAATVNVALYDLSGRKVMNILNNTNQTDGRYKIPVDVRGLANGVYIYTITVDGLPYSQKLTVVK